MNEALDAFIEEQDKIIVESWNLYHKRKDFYENNAEMVELLKVISKAHQLKTEAIKCQIINNKNNSFINIIKSGCLMVILFIIGIIGLIVAMTIWASRSSSNT